MTGFPVRFRRSKVAWPPPRWALAVWLMVSLSAVDADAAERIRGAVLGPDGQGIVGARVTFQRGEPAHRVTVMTDERGRYETPPLETPGPTIVAVRRIGWKDLRKTGLVLEDGQWLRLDLQPEEDPAKVARQLPANHWYDLVLARLDGEEREELARQCTYCHQQGSRHTRIQRDEEEWRKVLHLMGRMGGMLSRDLREKLPELFNSSYTDDYAVPRLTAGLGTPEFAPPPPPEVRRAVVEEWDLGGRASMQHDMMVHPDGSIFSVDMQQDQLYWLDPATGERKSWTIPAGDLPIGGVFVAAGPPDVPNSNARVGPHSLQTAPDGSVWITLAMGNQLARFDRKSEKFSIVQVQDGFYPHTLRFDARGRIWYTIAGSNHLGMWDPTREEGRELRLPSRTFSQALAMRMMPLAMWIGRYVDIRGRAAEGDGFTAPIPYGIDIAPDGSVWFSQLNEHRIGRVDPDDFSIEMIDTPFSAPRRVRFDAGGKLWIPGFSSSLIASFDTKTREFVEYPLPIEPLGSEVPYALAVHRPSGMVWICGTTSDTLIRFDPRTEKFRVYPLPTRVTYTRDIDFDREGRVWTSNSNSPAWQIEGGMPRVLRLDPRGIQGESLAQQRTSAHTPQRSH